MSVNPTLWNTSTDHIENFKGWVEILDTVDNPDEQYKFDSILSWSVLTRQDTEKHYSTNGAKKITSVGDSSTYELRLKNSADLYDTAITATQTRTITWMKNKIYGSPRSVPTVSLQGVKESNAAANEFIVDVFTATVENIDEIREEGKGVEEIVISGEILTHTSNIRQAAAPQE